MRLSELQNQKVAVLGYGKEGQAICRVLQDRVANAEVSVLCEKPLAAGIDCPYPVKIAPFTAGALTDFDVLIKSPGISLYHPAIQAAQQAGVVVSSSTNLWFAENASTRVVAITGTKGKSTTAALTAHVLQQCGMRVQLAGNIGLPLIDCLDIQADIWVLELSSFQVADLQAEPELSVLVSLFPEHLDWHGTTNQYFADKLRLLSLAKQALIEQGLFEQLQQHQQMASLLPAGQSIATYNKAAGWQAVERGLQYAGEHQLTGEQLPVRGRHNHVNACAALTIAAHFKLDPVAALKAVQSFKPLPHRLETVANIDGVTYINDSIATTPMATVKALEAFSDHPVVLIAGGFSRGLDWLPVVALVRQQLLSSQRSPLKAVLALPDNGGELLQQLSALFTELDQPACHLLAVADLEAAINSANEIAADNDVVLLSPGAASFSQFDNFEQRGTVFKQLVEYGKVKNTDHKKHG